MNLSDEPDASNAVVAHLQHELQARDLRFELLLDSVGILAYEIDDQGTFLAAHGRRFARLRLQPAQCIGRSLFDVFARYPRLIEAVRLALAGAPQHLEVDTDGVIWESHLVPILNEQGDVERVFAAALDVTESHQAESALRRSEGAWRSIFNNTLQAFLLFDSDRRLLAVNRVANHLAMEVLGKELAVGEQADELFARFDFLDAFLHFFDAALQGKMVRDHRRVRMGNASYWFEADYNPVRLDDGTITGVSLSVLDVTNRVRAERALRDSETQLRYIIDTVPEGVLLLGAAGEIVLANPTAEQFLEVLAPDRSDHILVRLGDRTLVQLMTSPPKGLWHDIAAGSRYFEAIARPVENGAENGGWVLVLRDVTQERKIQKHLWDQQRLAAVGHLAAGMAHDFNNILAVIVLYTQMLLRATELPSNLRDRVHTVEEQAQRAAGLIQQVLDFSRQSLLARRPLNLAIFLREMADLLIRTLPENIRVELQADEDEYIVQADPSRMQQVVMNLAFNARDAMPDGGLLRFNLSWLQLLPGEKAPLPGMEAGTWVVLNVTDNGSGIAPEIVTHIYEPFFTTKEVGKGTGLGLSQVYGIIQQHNGHIDVETAVGKGTTFVIYLPALLRPGPAAAAVENSTLPEGKGQSVLVVEDNPATRQAMVDTLRLLNYQVVEASHGREALEILRAGDTEVDLVVSDVVMPEMGGIALLHAMKEHALSQPLLLVTGHPMTSELQQLAAGQQVTFLAKPISMTSLAEALARLLSPDL
jgi:two-component system, cell cycle sensor histidine kinase and response regulator CckA